MANKRPFAPVLYRIQVAPAVAAALDAYQSRRAKSVDVMSRALAVNEAIVGFLLMTGDLDPHDALVPQWGRGFVPYLDPVDLFREVGVDEPRDKAK